MSSRGSYRSVYSALADDPDFQRLTPSARLTLYTARLCRDAGPSAIFRYYPVVLMAQTGLSAKQVSLAMLELQAGRWIDYDATVLWVRNGLRYDPAMTLANPKHRTAIEHHLRELPKSQIVLSFCDYYQIAYPFQLSEKPADTGKGNREPEREPEPERESLSRPAENAGQAMGILDWLNQKAGKNFRPVEANLALIRARLKDGLAPWQLKAVVSDKVAAWKGTDQAIYLRPATLFNKTKCEQYVGELPAPRNGDGHA